MAFKLSKQKDSVNLKCEAIIPNDRGGEAKHAFWARFRVPDSDERAHIRSEVRDNGADVKQFLPDWLEDWSQIYGEDDEPLPFNPDNVDEVMKNIYLTDAMSIAFADFLYDRGNVRRKN